MFFVHGVFKEGTVRRKTQRGPRAQKSEGSAQLIRPLPPFAL